MPATSRGVTSANGPVILWRLVIEYGEKDASGRYVEIGAVQLRATEAVADQAALALLDVFSRKARLENWARGVGIRMDSVGLGPGKDPG